MDPSTQAPPTRPAIPPWREALAHFVEGVRALYGPRLDRVVLYGSCARGEAVDGSDVDTLVVLDRCDDFWLEFDRIAPVANRVLLEDNVVISAFPLSRERFEHGGMPVLINARREGRTVS